MASSKEFKNFILERLSDLQPITCKPMMGEFLLYYNGKLFGGVYDNRLLIKSTTTNSSFSLPRVIPYPNAKSMLLVDNLDDTNYLSELIKTTCKGIK